MEQRIKTLCRIRDLYRTIAEFEVQFHAHYGVSLNEGMLMCTLKNEGELSASSLADKLGLSLSNTSKVISSVEKKGYLTRKLGEIDKRQMYFHLTDEGNKLMENISCCQLTIPDMLKSVL